jgi:putative ABC transport system substrate-binding protein
LRRTVRLILLIASIIMTLTAIFAALCLADQPEVVIVQSSEVRPFTEAVEGFEKTCDCVIGKIIITGSERSDIAAKVRKLQPDAVFALGMDAVTSVQSISDIPIFYTLTAGVKQPYPELANLSGVSMYINPERQIDAIMELLPAAKRIGVIYNSRNTSAFVEKATQYARSNEIEIISRQANSARDVSALLEGLKDRIDVLLMVPDVTVITPETFDAMLFFSFRNRIPIFTFSEKYVDMGAVAALTVDPYDLGAQTGEISRKVMSGRTGGGSVRAFPRKHVLLLNTKIAKKLGMILSEAILKKSVKVK